MLFCIGWFWKLMRPYLCLPGGEQAIIVDNVYTVVGSSIIRLLGLSVPELLAVAGWICSILSASPNLPWMDERPQSESDIYC